MFMKDGQFSADRPNIQEDPAKKLENFLEQIVDMPRLEAQRIFIEMYPDLEEKVGAVFAGITIGRSYIIKQHDLKLIVREISSLVDIKVEVEVEEE